MMSRAPSVSSTATHRLRWGSSLASFVRSDPDHEPFGLPWLRGLTPARVGLVAALAFVFGVRQTIGTTDGYYWWQELLKNVVFAAVQVACLVPTLVLITAADNASRSTSVSARVLALAAASFTGAAVYATAYWYSSDPGGPWNFASFFVPMLFRALAWGGFLSAALFFMERGARLADAAERARRDQVDLERQMAEARMRIIEAQIEPHFLFNTLANIKGLHRENPEHGRRMLRDLVQYLRAALPRMRDSASTLQRELALSSAYLRVLQVRMGHRLNVEIAVPDAMQVACVPPMMLPTLVENAVKHGLAPLRSGGTVRIAARREDQRLLVSVSDNGAGFRASYGTGIGLSNIRSRLATLFGDNASLDISANPSGGVTAVIDLPWRTVDRVEASPS